MFSDKELHRIVEQINDNYKNEELFYIPEGHTMPNRNTIIHITLGLRQIMFPGYFDEEHLCCSLPSYFIGHTISKLYNSLSGQIQAALMQNCKKCVSDEEASKKANEICSAFFRSLPDLQKMLMKDVQAAFDGDPAAHSKEEIIFCYPGLFAIFVYRMAHELCLLDVPMIPRIMTEHAHSVTGIDIHPGATIGKYFFIDHGTGIVIGETTIIGEHVKIYQGVTLGGLSTQGGQKLKGAKRHPTIGDNVTIYSGASILGGETIIEDNVVVGGNTFITNSVEKDTRVTAKKQELQYKNN